MRQTVRSMIAVRAVPAADREESCQFALRSRVGLQRHRVVPGDLGQPGLELLDHREVTAHVGLGRERVHARELRPRDGGHLGRGVELHRARTERDHAAVQRIVAVGELLEVAHHRRFAPVRVEHRMREVLVIAQQRVGHAREGHGIRERDSAIAVLVGRRQTERPCDCGQVVGGGGLVDRDAHGRVVGPEQLVAAGPRALDHALRRTGGRDPDRVEEGIRRERQPVRAQPFGERLRLARHLGRDPAEPVGPVVDRVHRGHDGQQHLGGADVRCRLLAADVLLARLQRETVGGVTGGILRHADQATGQLTFQARPHGHVARVRAAEPERNAEALRRADRDVGAERAR